MLTIFTILKSVRNMPHIDMLQRNALGAMQRIKGDPRILVFGNSFGTAEVCRDLGLERVAGVETNVNGLEYVSSTFVRAWQTGPADLFCYVNADIILPPTFVESAELAWSAGGNHFLGIGRRWNTPITKKIDFTNPDWYNRVYKKSIRHGRANSIYGIDYFIHRPWSLPAMPPLLVGRWYWDTALLSICKHNHTTIVDCSNRIHAIHQNHDYSHFAGGLAALSTGPESQHNAQFVLSGASNKSGLWSIEDADVVL